MLCDSSVPAGPQLSDFRITPSAVEVHSKAPQPHPESLSEAAIPFCVYLPTDLSVADKSGPLSKVEINKVDKVFPDRFFFTPLQATINDIQAMSSGPHSPGDEPWSLPNPCSFPVISMGYTNVK
eukprot:TRINITY_DN2497_c0_g6_i1.p1 TRINITY_DN2497_c0_g6~~TRINITY_DN2497_c0_g6_i1.p1  ORF type:complete len:124 (+),score=10.92 TRINITY_DN2497_c0_g6_i1:1027-1398(+)